MLQIVERKWKWVGHIARREPQHPTRQALRWHMEGKRRRGRPRETWMGVARKEIREATGMDFDEVEERAQDRGHWKEEVNAVRAYKAHRV